MKAIYIEIYLLKKSRGPQTGERPVNNWIIKKEGLWREKRNEESGRRRVKGFGREGKWGTQKKCGGGLSIFVPGFL